MIDKLWYDWQHKHKNNFWSFHGGSVGGFTSASIYAKYPNGAPPFLNVSCRFEYAIIMLMKFNVA
jgi:tyrosinase